jgi:hypothetical protein
MGLTVHFKLSAPAGITGAPAKKLVAALHRVALRFQQEGLVDQVLPVSSDAKTLRRCACDWLILRVPGKEHTSTGVEISPMEGYLFRVEVGEDCEPLWLGLCHYPATVRFQGRELPTKKGAGWRLAGFSKTQYASLHGWEHFQRCHCAVVNLLAACRTPSLRVKILDEGEFWPHRSLQNLRRNLEQMNGIVAALAGAVKDGATGVASPIFQHPHFERLEAEGEAKHGVTSVALTIKEMLDEQKARKLA